jgi:uncharacterized membrane protein
MISDKASNFAVWFSKKIFTWQSLVSHVIIYAVAWFAEGGDHHLFLDCISMEAVFVSLLVGMATARAEEQREILAAMDRERDQTDLETDQETNELIEIQAVEIQKLVEISKDIHNLSSEVHKHIKDNQRHNK